MHRLFLDANVLVAVARIESSACARLWAAKVALVTSRRAVLEARGNAGDEACQRRLTRHLERVEVADPRRRKMCFPWLDEEDWPIMQAAIEAGATHLLTGDAHFGARFGERVHGVLVTRARDYLESMEPRV